jgi:hypothetical protein
VEAAYISCDGGQLVANNPCETYLVEYCPSNYVTVTATPNPSIEDKFLPQGWNITGGNVTTNDDGTVSRTKRRIDTGSLGSTTVTVTSGCSSKSVKVIVYKAQFRLKVMRGHVYPQPNLPPFDISFGHAWWELSLEPTEAKSVFLKIYPQYYYYLDEGGFWPDGWHPLPIAGFSTGPGEISIGYQEPTVDSEYDWDINLSILVNACACVDYWYNHPPEFDLYHQNCTVVAILVAHSVVSTYIPDYTLPGDLADYLDSLNSND